MYELIITEKPNASKRIAEALAEGKPIREGKDGVYFYKISRGKQDIVVAVLLVIFMGLLRRKGRNGAFLFLILNGNLHVRQIRVLLLLESI